MDIQMTNSEPLGLGAEYQDTLALLQEEIASLEEEVRLRDAALAQRQEQSKEASQSCSEASASQIADLTAELARHEDIITLLFDELGIVGEAESSAETGLEHHEQWAVKNEQPLESGD